MSLGWLLVCTYLVFVFVFVSVLVSIGLRQTHTNALSLTPRGPIHMQTDDKAVRDMTREQGKWTYMSLCAHSPWS